MGGCFYRNSEVCVLVFDLTSEETFNNINSWKEQFLNVLNPPDGDKYPFVLIGNKCDMNSEIKITEEKINLFCQENNNMPYFTASAKDGTNLDDIFNKVAELAFERYNNDQENLVPEVKYIKIDKKEELKKRCC